MGLLYTDTTLWSGRFHFGTVFVTDTRATRGIEEPFDKYLKFHVITEEIIVLGSGSTRIIDLCIQTLRITAARLKKDGEDVTHELLVSGLKNNENLIEILRQLKNESTSEPDPEGATLLLVNSSGEDDRAVCKIEIKVPITHSLSRIFGCGSGYGALAETLDNIPYDAAKEVVVSEALTGFQEATRSEFKTGGHAIVVISEGGAAWTVYKDHALVNYTDWHI